MNGPVSATDANRNFSQLLRSVREEHATYVVTSHGKPVAKIVPFDPGADVSVQARTTLLSRLQTQRAGKPKRSWTREELYEDDR